MKGKQLSLLPAITRVLLIYMAGLTAITKIFKIFAKHLLSGRSAGLPMVALQEAGAPHLQLMPVMVSQQPDRRQPSRHGVCSQFTMSISGNNGFRFELALH